MFSKATDSRPNERGVSSSSDALAAGRTALKSVAAKVLPRSLVVWRGPRESPPTNRGGRLALTFDDGPTSLTPAYLDVLRRYGARATFFVVGEFCAQHPDLVRKIADADHELAGHGYTHRRFPTLKPSEVENELRLTAALLPAGSTRGRSLVRPPHGAISPLSLLACARAAFTTVLWSYDSGDSRTRSSADVAAAFERTEARTPGAIVLLHEGQAWTMEALPRILERLRKEGHELVTVRELLHG